MSIKRIVDPSIEPVSLEEARAHLNVTASGSPATHADDDLIESLIQAAREWCETFTGRAFIEQTWQIKLDSFPHKFRLPRPPLMSVTSIQYVDTAGDTQTLATSVYRVDSDSEPGRVTLEHGQVWPSTLNVTNAVTLTYQAGYDSGSSPQDASKVPRAVKQAILLMVGNMYENREEMVVGTVTAEVKGNTTVRSLLSPYITDKLGVTTE